VEVDKVGVQTIMETMVGLVEEVELIMLLVLVDLQRKI
jgi:hypothetical protein